MPSEIHVPTGLTTDGLLGRRYLARFIDSVAIMLLVAALALVLSVVVAGGAGGSSRIIGFTLLLILV